MQHAAPVNENFGISTHSLLVQTGKCPESNGGLQKHGNLVAQEINITDENSLEGQGVQDPEIQRLIEERQGLLSLGVYTAGDEIIQDIDNRLDELTRGTNKFIGED